MLRNGFADFDVLYSLLFDLLGFCLASPWSLSDLSRTVRMTFICGYQTRNSRLSCSRTSLSNHPPFPRHLFIRSQPCPSTHRLFVDTNRFSYQHLAKFGWDPTQGLGAENNQGNREHIKVVRKLDSSGIGVARAIKEGAEVGGAGEGLNSLFARLRKGGSAHEDGGSGASTPMVFNTSDEDGDEQENKPDVAAAPTIISPTPLSLGNSSRSKYVRSKRLAASSPAAMAEILGIPIASLPASPSPLSQLPQAGPSTLKPRVPQGQGSGNGSSDPFVNNPADEDDEERGKHTVAKISVAEYFRRRLAQKKAEREGAEVPVFDDEKPGGGYSEVAKGFEGKKIVFASNDQEDATDEDVKPKIEMDDDLDRAEGGVGGAGLGSAGDANKVRSEAVSPVLDGEGEGRRERKDREKRERREREKMEKRERKEKEKREKKEKKKGKGKEEVPEPVVKMEQDEPEPVVVKTEPGVDESSSVHVKQEQGVDAASSEQSGKKRKRSEQGADETEVRVKKEKKSKKEASRRVTRWTAGKT